VFIMVEPAAAMSGGATAAVALGAALVGGASSLLGSLLVNRREFRRQHRADLFLELLPALLDKLDTDNLPDPDLLEPDIKRIVRVATVSGRGDRRRSVKLNRPLAPYAAVAAAYGATADLENSDPRRQAAGKDLGDAKASSNAELRQLARDYQNWLAARFTGTREP
jgi:hypothetical protein